MKKLLSVFLVLSLLFSFSACSSDKSAATNTTNVQAAQSNTPLYPGLKESSDSEEAQSAVVETTPRDPVEALTQQCIQALFAADIASVFDMVHPAVMEHYMQLGNIDSVQYDAMIESYNSKLQASVDQLNSTSEDWEVSSSVIKQSSMTPDYLTTLSNNYASTGLVMQAGSVVHVQITVTADGQDYILPETARICIVQIGGQWYLEMSGTSF